MKIKIIVTAFLILSLLALSGLKPSGAATGPAAAPEQNGKLKLYSAAQKGYVYLPPVMKTDQEWQKVLNYQAYTITRKKGTEMAFTGRYWNNHEKGIYQCVACGTDLFS